MKQKTNIQQRRAIKPKGGSLKRLIRVQTSSKTEQGKRMATQPTLEMKRTSLQMVSTTKQMREYWKQPYASTFQNVDIMKRILEKMQVAKNYNEEIKI